SQYILCSVQDITQRKEAEYRHQQMTEELEKARRMESMGILAGGVAHDLNNMLGPLVGYPELIRMSLPEDSPLIKYVRSMERAAVDAAEVIQDLLALARRGRYDMIAISLNEVVRGYLESPSYVRLVENNPEVSVEISLADTMQPISGSAPHLAKAVMNLIVNAFDAMPDGGRLLISTEQKRFEKLPGGYDRIVPGEYVGVTVRDSGHGIDEANLEKVFEPYYSKKQMGSSGSGLGLAVVYGIIKDHQGYYDIITEPGHGTAFSLYLPAVSEAEIATEKGVANTCGHESVLIVDDDPQQREVAVALLASQGYQVDSVANGSEALGFIRTNRPDLLVLDMILENDLDGLDTYERILASFPDQKAILVSGFSQTDRVNRALALGAGRFVKKPYTRTSLGRAVRAELDRDRVRQSVE
ncbi:MAG: response regulator, partial [candidate division Zixibacteria bacterium]|nr:response regulator [candidate division Zixibacteria bacterium]